MMANKETSDERFERKSKQAMETLKNLKGKELEPGASPLARAYALGIPMIWATDVEVWLKMTLEDIAEEVCLADPVELLKVIAEAVDNGEVRRC